MGRLRVKTAVWIVFAAFCAVASKAQLFVPSGVRFSTGPGVTTRTFLAANGAFELMLDQPPQATANPSEITINATMSKVTGDARKLLWTRTVKGWGVQYIQPRDVYVSGTGDFFLMWHTSGRDVLLCREGQTISLPCGTFDMSGLFVSTPEDIVAVDDLDGQKVVRIWFAPDHEGRQDLFWRKAKFWILRTNGVANTNFARLESIGTATYGALRGSDIPRPDSLDVLLERKPWGSTQKFDGASDLMIFDEHGCGFRQAFYFERKKSIRYTFFQFPRSAKTWRLVGYSQPYDRKAPEENVIFDYTLTNLVRSVRRELIAMGLPAEIDLGRVRMKLMSVSQDSSEPHIEAKFYEHDQPAMDWFVREAFAADPDGNLINPLEMCRDEKSFRVTGYAGGADTDVRAPFEFVVPRNAAN
jgi:hypothetical protein